MEPDYQCNFPRKLPIFQKPLSLSVDIVTVNACMLIKTISTCTGKRVVEQFLTMTCSVRELYYRVGRVTAMGRIAGPRMRNLDCYANKISSYLYRLAIISVEVCPITQYLSSIKLYIVFKAYQLDIRRMTIRIIWANSLLNK